jgi:phosphoribosylanthranilate isomerase
MKPIELTLYDPETNEVKQTYTRSFIPWAILKKAMRMQKMLAGEMSEETVDELAALVVAVFGDQFTVAEASNGADIGEMATVIRAIISRAGSFVEGKTENPPPPAG